MKKILVFLFLFFSFWIFDTFAVSPVWDTVYPERIFYLNWNYVYYKKNNNYYDFYDSKTNKLIKKVILSDDKTYFSDLYYDNYRDKFYIFSNYGSSYYLESDFTFKEFSKKVDPSVCNWPFYRNDWKIKCIDQNTVISDWKSFWLLWFIDRWWTIFWNYPYYKVSDWSFIVRWYTPTDKPNIYDISEVKFNWVPSFWNFYWISYDRILFVYEENFKVKVTVYDFWDKKIVYHYDWLERKTWDFKFFYDYNCFFRLSVWEKSYSDLIKNCKKFPEWSNNSWNWGVDWAIAWLSFSDLDDFIEKEKPWDEIVKFVKNYKDFVIQNPNISNPEVWKKVSDFVLNTVKELDKLWEKWNLAAKAVMSSYYNILVNTWKINWSWAAKSIDSVLNYIKERDKKNSDYSWNSKLVNVVKSQLEWSKNQYELNKWKFKTCELFDANLKFIYKPNNENLWYNFDLTISNKFDVLLLKPFFYLADLFLSPLSDVVNESLSFISVMYPFRQWEYCFLWYVYELKYQSYLWIDSSFFWEKFFPEKNLFEKWSMNFLDYFFLLVYWFLVIKFLILIFNKNS